MSQKSFSFDPVFSSGEYLVPHSGIMQPLAKARELIASGLDDGLLFLVCGPSGVGKTHLISSLVECAAENQKKALVYELSGPDTIVDNSGASVAQEKFIAAYQSIKSSGGVLFIEANTEALAGSHNPHLLSRFKSGEILRLEYPEDEELKPILVSLLERHYLRLPDRQLETILSRVPAIPEYFNSVSKSLRQILEEGNKFKPKVLKRTLETAGYSGKLSETKIEESI